MKARPEKQRNWTKIIIILIIIAILAIALTNFLLYYFKYIYKVKQITVYNMRLTVGNHVGFNLDPGEINFGTVIAGGGATREVFLESDSPTKVIVMLEGDLAKWVGVSENEFVFIGNRTLSFVAATPENATKGNYTGKITIIFKEP